MASSVPGPITVNNETFSSSSRITREGRKITYRAQVIQQPERARACGSGAKSCADRRPVDPPPIVELKIFEGNPGQEKDITTQYNANFFVFATLENARAIAQGRMPNVAQTLPVLTGSPVAGMALLERPHQAGYFIFPDLSVRHEGKYRLTFSLYEELKEMKDYDSETPETSEMLKSAHVSHRLEVKTKPFTVFSAKKFPGLAESTNLSKIFAEQGCRVRIRREVRQRKGLARKSGMDDEDDYQQDYASARKESATPDLFARPPVGTPHDQSDRGRSASIMSNGHARRESAESMPHHQGQYTAPHSQSPQTMYPSGGHWQQSPSNGYAPPPPNHPQYAAPPPPPPAQPMAPPHYGYPPPQPNYAPPAPPSHPSDPYHNRNNSIGYPHSAQPHGPPARVTTPQQAQHMNAPALTYQGLFNGTT